MSESNLDDTVYFLTENIGPDALFLIYLGRSYDNGFHFDD